MLCSKLWELCLMLLLGLLWTQNLTNGDQWEVIDSLKETSDFIGRLRLLRKVIRQIRDRNQVVKVKKILCRHEQHVPSSSFKYIITLLLWLCDTLSLGIVTQIDLVILYRMDGLLKLIGGIMLTGLAVVLGGNLQCYILHHKSETDCRENDLERERVWHSKSRTLTHTCTSIYISQRI
jgi:hypothetical protein